MKISCMTSCVSFNISIDHSQSHSTKGLDATLSGFPEKKLTNYGSYKLKNGKPSLKIIALRAVRVAAMFICLGLLSRNSMASKSNHGGDSVFHSILSFPDKLFGAIDKKSAICQQKMQDQTAKYLRKLAKQEKKLQRKLSRTDSVGAVNVFGNIDSTYAILLDRMKQTVSKNAIFQNAYNGHIDSMQTALKFLDQNKLLRDSKQLEGQLQNALGSIDQLQNKLNGSLSVQQFLEQRQKYLTSQLKQYSLDKYLVPYKKHVYYYKTQVEEYTNLFNDPDKLEAKLIESLKQLPSFQDFFNNHSELASLFRLPGNDISEQELPGMQTRASVMQELEQRMGSAAIASNAVQQGMEEGQGELSSLKNKLQNLASGSTGNADPTMPNYKANDQHTRSFLKRIEFGTNLQSARPNGFFPITTDFALSAGYKLSSKSVAGVGIGYRIGWGQDIKHINITSQGLDFRSFVNIKLKGSFWLSGGFEYNYMRAFKDLQQLHKNVDVWQESALIGMTKKINAGKASSNVQILYDALWRQQTPVGQPLKFRIGYSLK